MAADPVGDAQALQEILSDLTVLSTEQLVQLFRQYGNDAEFGQTLRRALPAIVNQHAEAAALIAAQWYNEVDDTSDYEAAPVVDIPDERIDASARWALYAPGAGAPLDRLAGATSRMVYDAARDTITTAARDEGKRWVRYAQPDACAFCRMLATRTTYSTYLTEQSAVEVVGRNGRTRGTRPLGEKYHDFCRCVPIAIPAGEEYEPPDHVRRFEEQYRLAVEEVGNASDTGAILAHMRRQELDTAPDDTAPDAPEAQELDTAPDAPEAQEPLRFTREEGQQWASQHWPYTATQNPFTPEERAAIREYTSSSDGINGPLRLADHDLPDAIVQRELRPNRRRISALESAIDRSPRVPQPVVVTRLVDQGAFRDIPPERADELIDETFHDQAFLSTSVEAEGALNPTGNAAQYVMRISVPAGARGVYVSAGSVDDGLSSFGDSENELILARGSVLLVTAVSHQQDGQVEVHANLVEQSPEPLPDMMTRNQRKQQQP